jgi:hypothetical protein
MSATTLTSTTTLKSGVATVPGTWSPRRSRPDRRWTPLVIRIAVAADELALRRLAQLDSRRPLQGAVLLAEQDGSPIAAVSLDDGGAIADPFVATADALELVRLRAAQLNSRAAA